MKVCPRCKARRLDSDFAWRNKAKGIKQSWCKPCHREIDSESYRTGKRKKQVQALNYEYKKRNKEIVDSYKLSHGCRACGYNKCAAAIDLHHPDANKEANVSRMVNARFSVARLVSEIEKCIVVCCRCHREHHSVGPMV